MPAVRLRGLRGSGERGNLGRGVLADLVLAERSLLVGVEVALRLDLREHDRRPAIADGERTTVHPVTEDVRREPVAEGVARGRDLDGVAGATGAETVATEEEVPVVEHRLCRVDRLGRTADEVDGRLARVVAGGERGGRPQTRHDGSGGQQDSGTAHERSLLGEVTDGFAAHNPRSCRTTTRIGSRFW